MSSTTSYRLACWILLCALFCFMLCTNPARAGYNELHDVYTQIKPALQNNAYGIPVYINSRDENDTMTGVIYGEINHPYATVRQAIGSAANWCEIAPQHLNIKACTYQVKNAYCQLTFYTGRKFYEKADDVYQLTYRFDIAAQNNDFIHVTLTAEEGPGGTSHYRLHVEAIPLDKTRSFVYFSYSYQYNFITSMAMSTYLATLGRGKVGFSITGKDEKGQPVYIDGVRGIIERNSVRYYLAIQSYLDTLPLAPEKRFDARLNTWFDLTEKYPLQLHELDKRDYLEYKHQEHKDQLRLQQQINQTNMADKHCGQTPPRKATP